MRHIILIIIIIILISFASWWRNSLIEISIFMAIKIFDMKFSFISRSIVSVCHSVCQACPFLKFKSHSAILLIRFAVIANLSVLQFVNFFRSKYFYVLGSFSFNKFWLLLANKLNISILEIFLPTMQNIFIWITLLYINDTNKLDPFYNANYFVKYCFFCQTTNLIKEFVEKIKFLPFVRI